jgi:ADP-ribose pyrophosphatase
VIRHPGAVGVVVLAGDDVVLVRQFREPLKASLLEIPAGVRDVEGEAAEETARREVLEETGYRTSGLEPLGRIQSAPGYSEEVVELFWARAEEGEGPQEEGLEVVTMPFTEAVEACHRGEITDAKSVAGLLLTRDRLAG